MSALKRGSKGGGATASGSCARDKNGRRRNKPGKGGQECRHRDKCLNFNRMIIWSRLEYPRPGLNRRARRVQHSTTRSISGLAPLKQQMGFFGPFRAEAVGRYSTGFV